MRRYDARRNPIPPLAILAAIVALLGIVYLVPEGLRPREEEPAHAQEASVPGDEPVARGATEVDVAFADGTTERGEVVGSDEDTEIAVVRVNRDTLPAASFADGDPIV